MLTGSLDSNWPTYKCKINHWWLSDCSIDCRAMCYHRHWKAKRTKHDYYMAIMASWCYRLQGCWLYMLRTLHHTWCNTIQHLFNLFDSFIHIRWFLEVMNKSIVVQQLLSNLDKTFFQGNKNLMRELCHYPWDTMTDTMHVNLVKYCRLV